MREIKRIHYHHADGIAVGGRIDRPFEDLIPQKASLSLAPVGGHETVRSEPFDYREILSYKVAHIEVAGSASKPDGPWTTLVTTTVEGLNVLNVVTADRVVGRISSDHPAEGYIPKISFLGTHFENLRIGGKEIKPKLNLDLCLQGDGKTYPTKPAIEDQGFLDQVNQQRAPFVEQKERLGEKVRNFVSRHAYDYAGNTRVQDSGHVLCSLVQQIDGDCEGKLGHVIDLPDFGRIYLAELLLDRGSFQLIMLRFELGCPVVGDTSVVTAKINGRTQP